MDKTKVEEVTENAHVEQVQKIVNTNGQKLTNQILMKRLNPPFHMFN